MDKPNVLNEGDVFIYYSQLKDEIFYLYLITNINLATDSVKSYTYSVSDNKWRSTYINSRRDWMRSDLIYIGNCLPTQEELDAFEESWSQWRG